jgi:hypothetical protein
MEAIVDIVVAAAVLRVAVLLSKGQIARRFSNGARTFICQVLLPLTPWFSGIGGGGAKYVGAQP